MKLKSVLSNQNNLVSTIAVVLCWIMFFGFNYSRAALSLAIVGITALTFFSLSIKTIWLSFRSDHFSILCALYFISILISGIWSEYQKVWLESVLNALPFLVLPIGFSIIPWNDTKQMKHMIMGIVLLMVSGIIYSLLFYILNFDKYGLWNIHFESVPSMPEDYIRHTIGIAATLLLVIFIITELVVLVKKNPHCCHFTDDVLPTISPVL